jgi:hypothetical protein
VQEVVAAEDLGLRVAQEGEGESGLREVVPRRLGRIGADRDDPDAALLELRKPLLEAP